MTLEDLRKNLEIVEKNLKEWKRLDKKMKDLCATGETGKFNPCHFHRTCGSCCFDRGSSGCYYTMPDSIHIDTGILLDQLTRKRQELLKAIETQTREEQDA